MATHPAGPAPGALRRAKEICFLIGGQASAADHIQAKAREVYGLFEVLLSHRRWRDYPTGADGLVKNIKSACDRLRAYVVGTPAGKGPPN